MMLEIGDHHLAGKMSDHMGDQITGMSRVRGEDDAAIVERASDELRTCFVGLLESVGRRTGEGMRRSMDVRIFQTEELQVRLQGGGWWMRGGGMIEIDQGTRQSIGAFDAGGRDGIVTSDRIPVTEDDGRGALRTPPLNG